MNETITTQFAPNYAVAPGATLAEWLEENGMSQTQLASRMDRPLKTVNEIIKGKTTITHETALQLESVTGVEASFWTNADRIYQERSARLEQERQFSSWVGWATNFPFAEMQHMGWLTPTSQAVARVRSLLQYFAVASPEAWSSLYGGLQVTFRQAPAFRSDPAHLGAWLRKGEIEAQKLQCDSFEGGRFQSALEQIKLLTNTAITAGATEAQKLCCQSGVALVFVPELKKTRVCGATRWLTPTKALLQLSLRYKTEDHFWFTFFHEAAHVLLHSKKKIFVETNDKSSHEEREANAWAAEFLIPSAKLKAFLASGPVTHERITTFARQLSVAPGILVGRLQHDDHLSFKRLHLLKKRITWKDGLPAPG